VEGAIAALVAAANDTDIDGFDWAGDGFSVTVRIGAYNVVIAFDESIPPEHDCERDGHIWGDWVETIPPTCTEGGEETRTCQHCGYSEARPVAALGHNWGRWVETTAPTSTMPGEETRICQRCGYVETRSIPPLEPGEGGFTISFAPYIPVEIIGPTISLGDSPDDTPRITLLNPGQFDMGSIRWLIHGNEITGEAVSGSHGQTLILGLNIHNNQIGIHRVTVEVRKGGILHSRIIAFTVGL